MEVCIVLHKIFQPREACSKRVVVCAHENMLVWFLIIKRFNYFRVDSGAVWQHNFPIYLFNTIISLDIWDSVASNNFYLVCSELWNNYTTFVYRKISLFEIRQLLFGQFSSYNISARKELAP